MRSNSHGPNAAMSVAWTVRDLLLLKPAGQDVGLSQFEPALADCMAGYVDWLRANRVVGAGSKATLSLESLTPGVIEWPAGSGSQYVGVEAVFTVNEVI